MAKKPDPADEGKVKARVIVSGSFGKVDEVALLDKTELAAAIAMGEVDPHPDAVAYAESLKA